MQFVIFLNIVDSYIDSVPSTSLELFKITNNQAYHHTQQFLSASYLKTQNLHQMIIPCFLKHSPLDFHDITPFQFFFFSFFPLYRLLLFSMLWSLLPDLKCCFFLKNTIYYLTTQHSFRILVGNIGLLCGYSAYPCVCLTDTTAMEAVQQTKKSTFLVKIFTVGETGRKYSICFKSPRKKC